MGACVVSIHLARSCCSSRELLRAVVYNNDLKQLDMLMRLGYRVDFNNNELLTSACAFEFYGIVCRLLEDPKVDPCIRRTSCFFAVNREKRYDLLDMLLRNVDYTDGSGLLLACQCDCPMDVFKRLFEETSKAIARGIVSVDYKKLVHAAAVNNRLDILLFLESQVPKELGLRSLTSVFNTVIECGWTEVLEFLLRISPPSNAWYNPLERAITWGKKEIVQILVEDGRVDIENGIYDAAYRGQFDILYYLLDRVAISDKARGVSFRDQAGKESFDVFTVIKQALKKNRLDVLCRMFDYCTEIDFINYVFTFTNNEGIRCNVRTVVTTKKWRDMYKALHYRCRIERKMHPEGVFLCKMIERDRDFTEPPAT